MEALLLLSFLALYQGESVNKSDCANKKEEPKVKKVSINKKKSNSVEIINNTTVGQTKEITPIEKEEVTKEVIPTVKKEEIVKENTSDEKKEEITPIEKVEITKEVIPTVKKEEIVKENTSDEKKEEENDKNTKSFFKNTKEIVFIDFIEGNITQESQSNIELFVDKIINSILAMKEVKLKINVEYNQTYSPNEIDKIVNFFSLETPLLEEEILINKVENKKISKNIISIELKY